MIFTITLNPAVDKTLTLEHFDPYRMNRATEVHLDPGGKGINVSKTIHALGGQTLALGIVAGSSGSYISSALECQGIETSFVTVQGETRTNHKIFCQDTRETIEINEAGPIVTEDDLEAFQLRLHEKLNKGDICVIAGSLPLGVSKDYYAQLIQWIKGLGVTVILDADGEVFRLALQSKPNYIKPNRKELEQYFGREIHDTEDLISCGKQLMGLGIEHVIISMGSEGSLYMDQKTCLRAHPLKVEAHSSVGAGDAFVAALAMGLSMDMAPEELLRLATATSAGAVTTVGTKPAEWKWVMEQLGNVSIESIK